MVYGHNKILKEVAGCMLPRIAPRIATRAPVPVERLVKQGSRPGLVPMIEMQVAVLIRAFGIRACFLDERSSLVGPFIVRNRRDEFGV